MNLKREWVTPTVAGAFLLLAVTGVLMFFHLDSGLNKLAHEWLGWALVVAVGLHLTLNFTALKRQLSQRRGQAIAGLFVLLLGLSFVPTGNRGPGGREALMASTQALAAAPLPVLAQVAGIDEAELSRRLSAAGHAPTPETASVSALVGTDPGDQGKLIATVLRDGR
ncbi:DUF4405 domain-containing protein [Nitrogeniibacter mangrovi]|uniref:DUF4405 domain-containing protein n=1 Tax=Nitrogeniibacter mangrovi TaxID=2016596 RepID=A0A6C1B9F8_9RHOO|nr:DUF4405 domain-containing protein [Nitrogeniibacter mangrovi]QID19619.1 DUF4405 domain-containing protein [Nitrogeniibacter mangrovi]